MSESTMRDEDPRTARVRDLVEECLDRYEAEGQSAIDAVCAANPELADAILKRIRTLESMGLLESRPTSEIPERLGDFRILRKLGAGGMGVVFLAEQESLKRKVALKLVRPEHLFFEGARERFRREAEAVARLQHPGIVPVLTVGEQDGVPFYAMEYIEGCSLAEALSTLTGLTPSELEGKDLSNAVRARLSLTDEGPEFGQSWVNACLRVISAIADALAHAHERGVLHRDIKPSNIMLARDGRVLLLDFGLATVAGSATITRSGSQLGSMLYMAPELIRADATAADERSDIYGLGVTLYEMLCLRPPHIGESNEQIMLSVVSQLPERVRRRNPTVPDDAETVCHKAIELEPRDRYESAAAFSTDLKNVLELRPIHAVRPNWLGRARRFTRRRPAVALAATLAAVLLVGVPGAYAWIQRRAAADLRGAYQKVEAERTRAEWYLKKTFDAVERTLMKLGGDTFKDTPRASGRQLEVYNEVLAIFQEFEAESSDDGRLQRMLANCKRRIGYILTQLGRYAEAEASARQAIAILAPISAASRDDLELLSSLAQSHETVALAVAKQSRPEEAVAHWTRALDVLDDTLERAPTDPTIASRFAFAASSLSSMYLNLIQLDEAKAVLDRATVHLQRVLDASRPPYPTLFVRARANVFSASAKALDALGDPDGAERCFRDALTQARIAIAQDSESFEPMVLLGETLSNLASDLTSTNKTDEALPLLKEALPVLARLANEHSDQPVLANHYASCLSIEGYAHRRRGEIDESIECLQAALAVRREIAARFSDVNDLWITPASTLGALGDAYVEANRPEEAEAALKEANQILSGALADITDKVFAWRNLGLNHRALSEIAQIQDRFRDAIAEGEQALFFLRLAANAGQDAGEIGNCVVTLLHQCRLQIYGGDYRLVPKLANEMVALAPETREGSEGAAAMYLLAIAAFDADPDADRESGDRDAWVDAAIDCLRVAVRKEYTAPEEIAEGPICGPIREDRRFAKLLRDIEW